MLGMVHPPQAVLGGMIERGFGRIVAIASIVGLRASPNVSPYTTAKHAMVGLVRSVALETAGSGVTVNAVCPGYVDTDLIRGPIDRMVEKGTSKEDALARFTSRVPVGRLVKPEEVAEAVLYFCSPAAAATTGATLVIGADGRMMDDRTTIPLDAETKVSERPGRPQDRVAAVAAAAHLHDPDRERGAPPAARQFRHHAAALRSAGAARPRAERHDARRIVAAHDGVERQHHRAGRSPGRAGPDPPPPAAERPPRADRQPDAGGPEFFRSMARVNADWVGEIFAGLSPKDIEALMPLLAKTKQSARKALKNGDAS